MHSGLVPSEAVKLVSIATKSKSATSRGETSQTSHPATDPLSTDVRNCSKPHPARGYLFIAAATFFWGLSATMGRAVFTGRVHVGGQALRPIDPLILAQSRTTISLLHPAADPAAADSARRCACAVAPSGAVLPARNSRAGGLQLLLLFRHPEDDRRDGHRAAIRRSGLGAALHAGATTAASDRAARQRSGSGGDRLRRGGRRAGSAAAAFPGWRSPECASTPLGVMAAELAAISFAFYNVYGQHLSADLRALDGAGVFAARRGRLLAARESAVEDRRAALQRRAVALHGCSSRSRRC